MASIRSVIDYFTGTTRVDNEANPDSALNKRKREGKKRQHSWQALQKQQDMERAYNNTTFFGTPQK